MAAELDLIKHSAKEIRASISGVPDDMTLQAAKFVLKQNRADEDEDAVLLISIVPGPESSGWISDTGADGTAEVRFSISDTALAAVATGVYFSTVKVQLSSGAWTEVPELRRMVRILPSIIESN